MSTEAAWHGTDETKMTGGAHLAHEFHPSHACPPPPAQFAESAKLEKAIKANLKGLGYGG